MWAKIKLVADWFFDWFILPLLPESNAPGNTANDNQEKKEGE